MRPPGDRQGRNAAGRRSLAALVLGGLTVAAAPARACPTEVPPGLASEGVGEETVVNGLPVVIRQVTGRDPAAATLDRVARLWTDAKFAVRRDRVGEWDVVSARDAQCNTTLQLSDRQGAFGYFAVGTPSRPVDWLPKRLGFAMPGGISLASTVSSRDDGRAGHTLVFSSRRSVADLNDWFLAELSRAGWQAVSSHEMRIGREAPARVVTGQKGREQMQLVLRDDGLTRAVLNVSDAL